MKITAREELLLSECTKRNPKAIQQLADLHGSKVYGFLYSLFGTKAESHADLLSCAFADSIKNVIPYEQKKSFRALVMRRLIQNLVAQKPASFLEATQRDMRLSMMAQVLSFMNWDEKILILLRDQMDFSHQEIAFIMNLPQDQVMTNLQEARLHFRNQLTEILLDREKS